MSLNFTLLEKMNPVNELLLPHLKVSLDAAFWIHIFNFPLALEVHLPLIYIVLGAHEEIILPIWHRVRNNSGACGDMRLWSLQHVLFYAFLGVLVIALPVLTHVVSVEEKVLTLFIRVRSLLQIVTKDGDLALVVKIICEKSLLRMQLFLTEISIF
jgi:hypothetical protein